MLIFLDIIKSGYHAVKKVLLATVRKFESLFYKLNTCLQKTTTCNGFSAEQIFSVNT